MDTRETLNHRALDVMAALAASKCRGGNGSQAPFPKCAEWSGKQAVKKGQGRRRNSLRNMPGNLWFQSMKQFPKEISRPGYLNLLEDKLAEKRKVQ